MKRIVNQAERIETGSWLETRSSLLSLVALVLILGGVYAATLLPGVGYSGDTAKFQFLGKILGIPHPTGYPLYLVLNNLFVTLFPFGSVAYKANLLSAVFAVGGCAVLFKLLDYLGVGALGALTIALSFGLSRIFWSQALIAEVYTLHLLLMVSVLYALIRWHNGEKRAFYVATGLYALSFGNHLTSITLLPAFIYLTLATDPKVFIQPRKVLWVLGVVLLGIAQYSYLYFRYFNPDVYYAEVFNESNLLTYVTGNNFKNLMFTFSGEQLFTERLPLALTFLNSSLPLAGLAALGIVTGLARHKHVTLAVLLYLLTHTYYAMNYDIPDIAVYFIPSVLALAILAGLALLALQTPQDTPHAPQPSSVRRTSMRLRPAVFLFVPLALLVLSYRSADMSGDVAAKSGVEAALTTVQKEAIILAPNYNIYEYFLYYLLAEGWSEKNIYAALFDGNMEKVKAYLANGTSYGVTNMQEPPAGLQVFLFCYRCDAMRLQGLSAQPTSVIGLTRLELSAQP